MFAVVTDPEPMILFLFHLASIAIGRIAVEPKIFPKRLISIYLQKSNHTPPGAEGIFYETY